MAQVWRINKGQREQIEVALGDIWKDGSVWHILFLHGVHTETTKRRCLVWQRQMVHDGLIQAC